MEYNLTEREINKARPKPFFFISTSKDEDLTPEKIKSSLLELKACGYGGFVLFNKSQCGFQGKDYLSEAWFRMVRYFAEFAKELSLEMWINNGYDCPPGDVAGRIYELDPTLCQQRIVLENGIPTVKNVDWGFPAFENKTSSELFIKLVYENYKKYVGDYFGNPIVGFFADCDNRRIPWDVIINHNHPAYQYFPWSVDFAESFQAAYGYEILPYISRIIAREDIPQAVDYWEHVGNQYARWYEANHNWLQKHDLLLTGHTGETPTYLYETSERSSCFSEGRFSDIQKHFDLPGTDQELLNLNGGTPFRKDTYYTPDVVYGTVPTNRSANFNDCTHETRVKQAGSAAYLFNKLGTMSEIFAGTNFGVRPDELKQIAAYQMMQGVSMIVTHAYHYMFHGELKFFAPPEFSGRGMIGNYIRELNDWLASNAAMLSKGDPIYPILLLDPTEAVWRNILDEEEYFKTFAALNRLPYGFVIGDAKVALEQKKRFRVAVYAGFTPSQQTLRLLEENGVTVISSKELNRLEDLIPLDIQYCGEGTPHFVRRIIDNEEFLFVSNIEQSTPISGTIRAYGREKQIVLYPGDICYISKCYENIPGKALSGLRIAEIPELTPVTFDRYNFLPLEYFRDETGNVVRKNDEKQNLYFRFDCAEDIDTLRLYIPKQANVALNGQSHTAETANVYDDDYFVYDLHDCRIGENELVLSMLECVHPYDQFFLEGDFDIEITNSEDRYLSGFGTYNFRLWLPKHFSVTLKKRRKVLSTARSWAVQGQNFYSGKVTYHFRLELPQDGIYKMTLPQVRDVVSLELDANPVGKCVFSPYIFTFRAKKGIREFKLTVSNSLGNQMECCMDESGILAGGFIELMK